MNGYSIALIPQSWACGVWRKRQKTIFACGPFRFVIHRGLREWKPSPLFERDGEWYIRNGDGTTHKLLAIAPNLEREALKDADYIAARREGGARSGPLGFDG